MMWPIGVPFSMTLSDHHLRRHLLVAKPTYRMQRLSYSCAAIIPIITRFQLTRVTRSVCGCELANLVKFSLRVDLFPRVVQQGKQVCWTSLLSDQKLRGPHVAQQQQLSIDICGPRATWAANPLTAAACCRWTGQTDGHTDGRTLHRFMTLIAYYADRVINRYWELAFVNRFGSQRTDTDRIAQCPPWLGY